MGRALIHSQPMLQADKEFPVSASFTDVLNRRIYEDPEKMRAIVTTLGAVGLGGEDIRKESDVQEVVTMNPEAMDEETLVFTYFGNRFDRHMNFDDDTQAALARDKTHKELLADFRRQGRVRHQLSSMTSRYDPNPNAAPLRDQLRERSIVFFIDRVERWQKQQDALPSAG